MADVRYQFFLSSTFEDLRRERQQVIEAVLEMGHIPVGMEVFPAADETPWEIIKRAIAQSDYYIVLSAGRYGSCGVDGRSYTEREFDLAVELGVPIIGFLAKHPFDRPEMQRDDDPDLRHRLAAFHAKISERHLRKWASVEELGLLASKAIIHATTSYPRTGWVRADQAKSLGDFQALESLRSSLEQSQNNIERLEEDLEEAHVLIRQSVLQEDDIQPELLAGGDDEVDVPVRYALSGERFDANCKVTWDEIFATIGPKMYNVRLSKGYSGRFDFEKDVSDYLKERMGIIAPNTQVKVVSRFLEVILFQFKQRGLLMLEVGEQGRTWWTLTPKGEVHLTRLLVVRKG